MSKRFIDPQGMREIVIEPRSKGVERATYNKTFNKTFKTNQISTTKYHFLTFLPVGLFIQFKRYANIYFLITAILQSTPYISPLNPVSAIVPLIFVIGVTLLREAFEDYNRYKNDKLLNNTKAKVFDKGAWVEAKWKDIQVGDFVRVECDEVIPADLLILYSGISGAQKGASFIETGSLDGEKSLKQRLALVEVMKQIEDEGLENFRCKLNVGGPSMSISQLTGGVYLREDKYIEVDVKQLLLRGAFLKNTEYAYGVAIYCGHESKIMMNTAHSRFKVTKMENNMGRLILMLLLVQFTLIACSIVGYTTWNKLYHDYFEVFWVYEFGDVVETILMIFSYFLIYNTLLPISLMVTIDIAKLCQTYFIGEDVYMFNAEKGKGCKVMTRSINEELGQVEYVFTDKTGTLTQNVMNLQHLVVGEHVYEGKMEEKKPDHSRFSVVGDFFSQSMHEALQTKTPLEVNIELPVEGGSPFLIKSQEELCREFLKVTSMCHDCVVHMQKPNELEEIIG